MKRYIAQANHNQEFHDCICSNYGERYFDWKITIVFYVAVHLLKALAASRSIEIGCTHPEVERNVNPDRHDAKMRITKGAWYHYRNLYIYSRTARYDGIEDAEVSEALRQNDYRVCITHLKGFKSYVISQGLNIEQ